MITIHQKTTPKIEFGNGDILSSIRLSDESADKVGQLQLYNSAEKGPIGEYVFIEHRDPTVVINFKNIQSLDVMLEELQILKEAMIDSGF